MLGWLGWGTLGALLGRSWGALGALWTNPVALLGDVMRFEALDFGRSGDEFWRVLFGARRGSAPSHLYFQLRGQKKQIHKKNDIPYGSGTILIFSTKCVFSVFFVVLAIYIGPFLTPKCWILAGNCFLDGLILI